MRSRTRRTTQFRDVMSFWSLIIVVSIVLAALAFAAGKYWVGGLIAQQPAASAPRLDVKTPGSSAGGEQGKTEPPPQAVVKMEQRAPTDAERSEIEQNNPQDGATLHGAGASDTPDASKGGDAQPMGAEGKFQVVAGSYRSEENAQRQVDELAAKGFSATVVDLDRDGAIYHRVVVGSFDTQDEAQPLLDQVTAAGVKANIRPK